MYYISHENLAERYGICNLKEDLYCLNYAIFSAFSSLSVNFLIFFCSNLHNYEMGGKRGEKQLLLTKRWHAPLITVVGDT
jgi:hypothetical protein